MVSKKSKSNIKLIEKLLNQNLKGTLAKDSLESKIWPTLIFSISPKTTDINYNPEPRSLKAFSLTINS